jgi:hypothetical protein
MHSHRWEKKDLTVTQSNNPQERKGNSSNWLPKIVNKDNCFKGQQRKEHDLQINRRMISNWANTKEKKCQDYKAEKLNMHLRLNNSRNLNMVATGQVVFTQWILTLPLMLSRYMQRSSSNAISKGAATIE